MVLFGLAKEMIVTDHGLGMIVVMPPCRNLHNIVAGTNSNGGGKTT